MSIKHRAKNATTPVREEGEGERGDEGEGLKET
jgi:hypothetical protein